MTSLEKQILVPVDFSKGSDRAVEQALELAQALGAELELFHAYQLPVFALPDVSVSVSPTYVADLTDRAQQALHRYASSVSERGVAVRIKLTEGNSAEAIVSRAQELAATMIVLGTHGRGGFRRFLLGSTAERVVRMATVPVLTVHLPES